METQTLDARTERNLRGVHDDLQRLVRVARSRGLDFIVTEGVRTLARQRELVAAGASRTMASRHLTGHAIDVAVRVGGRIRWDWPLYETLASQIKSIARELGIRIVWGGDWPTFRDGPHIELDRTVYPAPQAA
jgi:peptidoglycan L-alanyl-D-glutamate endopeptidase CwlK